MFTDQLNRKIELTTPPQRIVSLVPSQTELLYDLGLRDEVVGITKFCIHPDEWFRTKTRVGGTKKIDFDTIKNLAPDLIIGNKEENEQQQIEQLIPHYPVWMSDIHTLKEALDMITRIGALVGKQQQAVNLKLQIEAAFRNLQLVVSNRTNKPPSVAYLIWKHPYMAAGKNTFINDMLQHCGFQNVFGNSSTRYPEIEPEDLTETQPDIILLSSEPYPFKQKHIEEFQQLCPQAKVIIADGEMFSWYGSRLLYAPAYFEKFIQQQV